jgi:ribonuclease-3
MSEHPVEIILQYHFSNRELLDEALLAAGASVSRKDVQGDAQGNKRLALLGDSVLREAVLEPWYSSEESTGECRYVMIC